MTPEERRAEKERILAYIEALRGRWALFWHNVKEGRRYWRHSLYRVWGTDAQGQKHNLGMEYAATPQRAIEARLKSSSYPEVLAYQITATGVPRKKSLGEHVGNLISATSWTLKEPFRLHSHNRAGDVTGGKETKEKLLSLGGWAALISIFVWLIYVTDGLFKKTSHFFDVGEAGSLTGFLLAFVWLCLLVGMTLVIYLLSILVVCVLSRAIISLITSHSGDLREQ
jgi:hypothetical protein